MTSFPRVTFILDQKIDTRFALNFAKESKGKEDRFIKMFFPNHLRFVFGKEFSEKEREKIIRKYVEFVYSLDKPKIEEQFRLAERGWRKKEKRYFALIGKVFKKHPWPEGKYIGFGTVFVCYPRFLDSKTFLFPLNSKRAGAGESVTAHELLHFLFFDYIGQKYRLNEESKIKGKDPRYVWKISEAFNSVLENWEPYRKIFPSDRQPYPETMEIYKKMKKAWDKTEDLDKTIRSVLPRP